MVTQNGQFGEAANERVADLSGISPAALLTITPGAIAWITLSPPNRTASQAGPVLSMQMTKSAPLVAEDGRSAIRTPSSSSDASLAAVRFQAVTSKPAWARP